MKKVDIQDFASALVEAYEDYTEDVVEGIKDAADEISKDMLAEVRERAPKSDRKGANKYYKGFRRMRKKLRSGVEYEVWNPKHYRLVHLLEKGWTSRKGKRVPGTPHMGPAEVKHTARFEKRAEQIIKEGGK